MKFSEEHFAKGTAFEEYIDWRADHPSDDIMTELLNVEFTDEHGTVRRLTRQELLTYVNVVAGAGTRPRRGSSAGPARCSRSIPTSAA